MAKRIPCKIRISNNLKLTIGKMAFSEKKTEKERFLYEVVDEAILWAKHYMDEIPTRIPPKSVEEYSTIYYTRERELEYLSTVWDCTISNALYSIIFNYVEVLGHEKVS